MRYFLLLLFIASFSLSNAQSVNSTYSLVWRPKPKLMWRDYKAKAKKKYKEPAYSYVSLTYDFRPRGKYYEVNIHAYFRKDMSWVKEENKSDFLLKHEQGHFDICELVSRRFRKEISDTSLTDQNYASVTRDLINKYKTMNADLQAEYDRETENSSNVEEQLRWSDRIESMINALEEYSDSDFKLPLN